MRQRPSPVVYRIVRHDPPTREDFLPPSLAGPVGERTRAVDPRLLTGISTFRTERQATAVARRYPALGSFIAEVRLPTGARSERTLRRRGHFTVWGDPDELLDGVQRVTAVT